MKTLEELTEHPLLAQAQHLGDHAPSGATAEGFALAQAAVEPQVPEVGDDCIVAGLDVGLARELYAPRALVVELDRVQRWLVAPGDDALLFHDDTMLLIPEQGFAAYVTEARGVEVAVGMDCGLVRVWKLDSAPYALPNRPVPALEVPAPHVARWGAELGAPAWLLSSVNALAEGSAIERFMAAGLFARGFVPEDEDAAFDRVQGWASSLGASVFVDIERAACDRAVRVGEDAEALPDVFELGAEAVGLAARRLALDRDALQSVWVALKLVGTGDALGAVLRDVDAEAASASFALNDALAEFPWSEDELDRWSALAWQSPLAWWIPEREA